MDKSDKNSDVGIIIVLYYPTENQIKNKLLIAENHFIIFVDNTPDNSQNPSPYYYNNENISYIPLGKNKGIAAAQNVGIREARLKNIKTIIFFDQDSEVSAELIDKLLLEYERLIKIHGDKVILGPNIYNERGKKLYKQSKGTVIDGFKKVDSLISTGTTVNLMALEEVGGMKAELFIDSVDFEWCLRAQTKGYKCYQTQKVSLPHTVGRKSINFLGYPFIISNPVRYYYIYRNYLWLCHNYYVPSVWKRKTGIRRFVEAIMVPIFTFPHSYKYLKHIFRGIIAGIK